MAFQFGMRTGTLDLLDWDEAVIRGFCAEEDLEKEEWFLPLDGIFIEVAGRAEPVDRALVVYKRPEPTQITATLPMIAVIRDSIIPAEERLLTIVQQFKLPTDGAAAVSAGGMVGYTEYDTKDKAQPYDFIYTIECWARYRTVAQMLLQMVMAKYPHRGTVLVTDSIGCERTYATYQQGVNDLTEVSSMVERIPGFSLTIKVEGELTLDREQFSVPAFTGTRTPEPLPGHGDEDEPDPGPGGLYGTGHPIIRSGIYSRPRRL